MTQDMTLEQLIHCVIDFQRSDGHTELYINQLQMVYNRLLKLSEKMGESHLSDELTAAFLSDDKKNSKSFSFLGFSFIVGLTRYKRPTVIIRTDPKKLSKKKVKH